MSLIEKNFHSKLGEIDLIMKHDSVIVFVEVKFRKNNHFGGAISAVSISKQKKIILTAQQFLQHSSLNPDRQACRFDVIAIEGENMSCNQIHWLKNAFCN